METKHTKGEWIAESKYDIENEVITVNDKTGIHNRICNVANWDSRIPNYDEDEANAKLIAAAPDLLEALQLAKQTIKIWHGEGSWKLYLNSPEMKLIDDAIKKATE